MSEVILRAVREADLELLTGGESEFDDWGPRQPPASVPPAGLDHDGGELTVELEGEVAGQVSWHYQRWGPGAASRNPMIGIWLRPSHRGRGAGVAAQRQLAALFFEHTATHRVEAHTDVTNLAEQRALERAGYHRDGVMRGAQWRGGAYHDMCVYSILRSDPRTGEQ